MTDKALALTPANDIDTMTLGNLLAKSGYFADAKDAAQAVVKVLAGKELGLGPVASMTGVYIVKGKPSLSANLLAGVLKRSGKYTFRVIKHDDTVCEIAFFERLDGKWEEIGRSMFTAVDAKRAGTQNMDRFPRNMLYARAMTNGIRWYAPDVFAGGVYTPEELGAPVNSDGEVIEAQSYGYSAEEVLERARAEEIKAMRETQQRPAPAVEAPKPANGNGHKNGNGRKNLTTLADWRAAYAEAVKVAERYGIQAEPADGLSLEELMEAGKALKNMIANKKAALEAEQQEGGAQ